jgi:hypothetical protein
MMPCRFIGTPTHHLGTTGDTIMARKPREQMSMQELVCRQVYGLVRETAEAICPERQSVIEVEADLLNALAVNCAAKHDLARALVGASSGGEV